MNMEAIKKSLQKLQQLGYFKIAEEPGFSVRPEEKKVDILIKGTEASKNQIQFGAGYSALDGFFGQFSFQTRNFLGRGEVIGASAQMGRISNYYDLSYTVPWFMDRNQTVGVSLFRRNVEYLNIDERRQGGTAFYGKGIGLFDSWSILYAVRRHQGELPGSRRPGSAGAARASREVHGGHGDDLLAHSGVPLRQPQRPLRPEPGLPPLPDVAVRRQRPRRQPGPSSSRSRARPDTYRSAFPGTPISASTSRPVTSLPSRVATSRSSSGSSSEGSTSLRGFRTGSILPLKDNDQVFTDEVGRILGGDKYFILNVEYVFASVGPAKLLAFTDVGNVYHEDQSIRLRSTPHLRRRGAADLPAHLPGPAALHLLLQPRSQDADRPVRIPDHEV